jgi:triosephosphate isomerase
MSTPSRQLLIGTNLKMNQTAAETRQFITELAGSLAPKTAQYFVIPPFTSLPAAIDARDATGFTAWIGAQNMHWEPGGAFTGEISASMLTALGVDLVLLGHAERRGLFNETDEQIGRKVGTALGAGLRVLLCVGETAAERAYGVGLETVDRQLKIALHGVTEEHARGLNLAYEPVWSIGAGGTPATPDDIGPVVTRLRSVLTDQFGVAGGSVPILYGGSVDAANSGAFVQVPEISGLFVGRAAWTAAGFQAIVSAATTAGA